MHQHNSIDPLCITTATGAMIQLAPKIYAVAGLAGLVAITIVPPSQWVPTSASNLTAAMSQPSTDATAQAAGGTSSQRISTSTKPIWAFGAYGGSSYTLPSTVEITKNDGGKITVKGFDWIGRPFKAPVYYGARIQRWSPFRMFGTMLDFTHAKAIANPETTASLTGKHNGQPLPANAKIKDVFSKLEFSHGHNMLTLNGLLRFAHLFGKVRPYFGAGGGINLPHTEVGFKGDNTRTYEYQFTGYTGQALAGLEIDLGRMSVFIEYKFSYSPYGVPLSQEPAGDILVTDLWRQFSAWWKGEKPPGGHLIVDLASHHTIAGFLVKSGPIGR